LTQVSVVFVDVRGFTSLSERLPPTEVVARLNRFYGLAAQTVFRLDGTLDKLVGDQVMAFFGAPFCPDDHPQRAVRAALEIVAGVEAMAQGPDSPSGLLVGGGVGTGEAFMGNVAEGEVRDFTVIGDVVNTAARLQGAAQPGEVLVMEETYRTVATQFPDAPQRTLELRGKAAPVAAWVLRATPPLH
jgi:adenylate cyclase